MNELTPLRRNSDARGRLVAVKSGVEVPFAIRRVFWVYENTRGLSRAGHANSAGTGSAGRRRRVVPRSRRRPRGNIQRHAGPPRRLVDRPADDMAGAVQLTADCVLLVLANTEYDPDDTIASLDSFKALTAR